LPFLTEGNTERFEQAALSNLKKFSTEADCIVTDCASCESTLLSYPKYVDDASKIKVKTFVNWGDLIAEQNIKFKSKKSVKVTFHKPCHLRSDEFFEKIIANCENVEYIKMENYDACCGFAGSFALKNPKLSHELSKQKAENIKATGADYVITTCPSCILGLKQGLRAVGSRTKVVSLLEFLAKISSR
jgi:glycolate oxidase iron-sulfur subunit